MPPVLGGTSDAATSVENTMVLQLREILAMKDKVIRKLREKLAGTVQQRAGRTPPPLATNNLLENTDGCSISVLSGRQPAAFSLC